MKIWARIKGPVLGIAIAFGTLSISATWAMKSIPGLPVKKISHASNINNWQIIDQTHVILSFSASRNYLVTLRDGCHGLKMSHQLGISSSNNTVYAGFDYITADGQRCSIRSINKLSRKETMALRS